MDDPGTLSPDPEPQPIGIPGPTAAPTAAPAPRRTPFLAMSWPRRRRVGAALAVVALATTGGVAIAATSGTPSPSPSPEAYAAPGSPQEQKQLLEKQSAEKGALVKGMKGRFGLGRGVVHGEFVAPDGNGGYVTNLMQTGTVTSVGDSSLGVKSEDGYTRDYALNADTVVNGARGWTAESKGGVANGQTVTVMATRSGDTATATMIMARDAKAGADMLMPGDARSKMFKFRGGPGGMPDLPMMPGGDMGRGDVRRFEFMPGDKGAPGDKVMPAPAAPTAPDEVAAPTPSSGT
jgi:hypothetical protein